MRERGGVGFLFCLLSCGRSLAPANEGGLLALCGAVPDSLPRHGEPPKEKPSPFPTSLIPNSPYVAFLPKYGLLRVKCRSFGWDTCIHSRDMARRAPGAWKTPVPSDHKQDDDTSFPGLKPANPDATPRIEYDELQQNEVLALEAIYGDDFAKHVGTPGAWKVKTSRSRHCHLPRRSPWPRKPSRHSTFTSEPRTTATLPYLLGLS